MEKKNLRIMFMGTPPIASFVLEAMIKDGFNIIGVIAQPDKPVGRKKEIVAVPTKIIAMQNQIPVFQPLKIRSDYEFVKELNPDIIITLAYGQIVPQGLLDIPKYGCLNLHGSLLPKYRGAAPMQYALINGETETGICLMEMIDKMDAGRVYAINKVEISPDETLLSLTEKMKICARDIILKEIMNYVDGKLLGIAQDESLVTLAPSIKKEQEHLDLNLPAHAVVNWIKALNDHPGAYVLMDGLKLKIWQAAVINNRISHQTGEIIIADKKQLIMQASDGQISLLELQKEGKEKVDYKAFINGTKDLIGKILQ